MREFSREDFVRVAGGALAGFMLFGCARDQMEQLSEAGNPELHHQLYLDGRINGPARALEPAVRLNPPDPIPPAPQKSWFDGQFVKSVIIPYNGLALNYDDGPSPYNTDPILRTLAKYGIKGTFPIIGVNAIAWPEIVLRIRDEGHEIANHSHTHSPYSAVPLANQIPVNQQIIYDIARLYPVANRAPGLTRGQAILDMCRQLGMYEVHTTIDSLDWKSPRIPSESIVNNVLNQLHPGAFPLQHDGGNSRPTPLAQEGIIQGALARGYVFNTITGLLNTGTPSPGTFGYALTTTEKLVDEPKISQSLEVEGDNQKQHIPEPLMCNYDPEVELLTRLDDVRVKYAEKRRIQEALLQIEESKKAA